MIFIYVQILIMLITDIDFTRLNTDYMCITILNTFNQSTPILLQTSCIRIFVNIFFTFKIMPLSRVISKIVKL